MVSGAVAIWREVYSGRRRAFPRGFWSGWRGREAGVEILHYLVAGGLDPLSLTDLKARRLKLRGAVLAWGGLWHLLDAAFPDRYLPWQLPKARSNLWKDMLGIWGPRAVRWLVEEKLKLSIEEVPKKLRLQQFRENGLGGLAKACSNRLFVLVDLGYPGVFRPLDMGDLKEWWRDDALCREAVLEVCSRRGVASAADAWKVRKSDFSLPGLRAMLSGRFGGSLERALEFALGEPVQPIYRAGSTPKPAGRELGRGGRIREKRPSGDDDGLLSHLWSRVFTFRPLAGVLFGSLCLARQKACAAGGTRPRGPVPAVRVGRRSRPGDLCWPSPILLRCLSGLFCSAVSGAQDCKRAYERVCGERCCQLALRTPYAAA